MIVKNESKIITRLFDSVLPIIDCYCICDTGSNDNTISIIQEYFNNKNISGKIITELFKNFSHNRNIALSASAGMSDYALLLDADMVLRIDQFDKNQILSLNFDEYKILQGDDNFNYLNTRIVKNNGTYKYFGVTHEYIGNSVNNNAKSINITKDVLFILDIGDGGSKTNKFERDIELLTQGIIDEPNNTRYYFYLGNSYFDLHKNDEAIDTYQKLLSMNGWSQEKYIACIRIYDAYTRKNQEDCGIQYLIQSHTLEATRIDGIYRLIKFYCIKNMDKIAYSFYSFIEKYYEYVFLTEIDLIGHHLFAVQLEYKYFLPYYMIIVSDRVKKNIIGIKMYNIIFMLKSIDAGEWWANNLVYNFQYFIDHIDSNSIELDLYFEKIGTTISNFYNSANKYFLLLESKFNIIHKDLLHIYRQKIIYKKVELDEKAKLDEKVELDEKAELDEKVELDENKLFLPDNILSDVDNIISNIEESLKIVEPIPAAHTYNKIILTLMIKNESKIIERCIENSIYMVDAISILDTGSTDNTVEICTRILTKYRKPFNITVEEFKNFGYNRSISFSRAKDFCNHLNWDLDQTYAMVIDADMVLKASEEFKNFKLTENGYKIIQKNGNIIYYNMRFLKFSYDWTCIGATHEYWSGDSTGQISQEIIYIDDCNDGGCKSDKSERDIRLLNQDINENKNVDRSHFYLAQTLKDIGQLEPAIEKYTKRIELGGWFEEIWYSHYQIAKCYLALNKENEMEYWMNKAYEYNKNRAEPLYFLTNHYRIISQHYKAYHYYLKGKNIPFPHNELLFIENDVYNGLFDYENTILSCYLCKTRQQSLCELITYINKNIPYSIDNVWDNLHYYIETLDSSTYNGVYTKYNFNSFAEYTPSSCSLIKNIDSLSEQQYILNIRLVNYSIDENGYYHMRHSNNKVVTKNAVVYLDKYYLPIGEPKLLFEDCVFFDKNIEGLEDVRIFNFQNETYMTASSKNSTNNENIDIVIGNYNYKEKKIYNIIPIKSPNNSECEKNWIFIPESAKLANIGVKNNINFIYGWHPLEIANISNNELHIHTSYNITPTIFSKFRGSSSIVEYNNKFWAVAHFVKYSQPRVYYHSVVVFNKNIRPIEYSAPFCFRQNKIEYCLGFNINNGIACFIFSENDSNPGFITIPLTHLKMINI